MPKFTPFQFSRFSAWFQRFLLEGREQFLNLLVAVVDLTALLQLFLVDAHPGDAQIALLNVVVHGLLGFQE
jgi:hypothetical protein